jgi:hypothetical protein
MQKLRLAIAVTYKFIGRRRSTLRRFLSAFVPTNIKEAPTSLVTKPCSRYSFAHRTRHKANSMIIFIFTHGGSRTRSFGPAKGMSIVLWKGPRIPLASIRQCKIEKGCIRRAKTSHVPAPFGVVAPTNHPLGPGILAA